MDSAEKLNLRERLASIVQRIPGAAMLFAAALLVVLGYFGWFYYGADHLDQALYSLRFDKLQVTPQPDWIKSDVANEVYTAGRLDRISLLEPRATAAIAQAFETHTWVASITRVTKSAGGSVNVDVVYRRPVAMVYTEYYPDPSPENPGPPKLTKGFYAVDESGTVLPRHDFTREDVRDYFLIFAQNARPAGEVGMPYGDVRISEALRLCTFLEPHRHRLHLQEIWINHDGVGSGPSPWTLLVTTEDNREIVWGHAPGTENSGELPAPQKLEQMLAWLQAPRDESKTTARLDLRHTSAHTPVSY
ncbi:MAG: hypothetical protein KDA45_10635 [Planctomycetales bacterium]|nr:hypothetical protein [Planctomycetales bacterium]